MRVSRCRFWWCSKCHAVFEKEDLATKIILYGGSGEGTILGTRGCGNCESVYEVRDIYAGKHDVPRQHWGQLQQPVELPEQDAKPPQQPTKALPDSFDLYGRQT